jgi:hypothetical protein
LAVRVLELHELPFGIMHCLKITGALAQGSVPEKVRSTNPKPSAACRTFEFHKRDRFLALNGKANQITQKAAHRRTQERDMMVRMIFASVAALALASSATAAPKTAATKTVQCKDAKGKFIKCPTPVAKAVSKSPVAVAEKKTTTAKSSTTMKTKQCRDAKGRFAKCGTPGAK